MTDTPPPCPRCGQPCHRIDVPIEPGDTSWVWGHDCNPYDYPDPRKPNHGSRPVTKQDRALAIKRELLRTRSPFRMTPGMIRHFRSLRTRRILGRRR